jgi:hypothetical protein
VARQCRRVSPTLRNQHQQTATIDDASSESATIKRDAKHRHAPRAAQRRRHGRRTQRCMHTQASVVMYRSNAQRHTCSRRDRLLWTLRLRRIRCTARSTRLSLLLQSFPLPYGVFFRLMRHCNQLVKVSQIPCVVLLQIRWQSTRPVNQRKLESNNKSEQ